nr:EOG090X05AE [Artemia franciscana]
MGYQSDSLLSPITIAEHADKCSAESAVPNHVLFQNLESRKKSACATPAGISIMKLRQTATLLNRTPTKTEPVSPKSSKSELVQDQESENPELARYLNRSYWENVSKSKGNEIADGYSATVEVKNGIEPTKIVEKFQNGEMDSVDDFALNLRNQIEMFVNRMKSNSSRGRYIANDTSVQTLFLNITAMHSELLKHTQDLDQRRGYYETLQDKLTQARDARAALDALREEHREKLRRAAEEADRQRQMQMAFKLDIMRKKKQLHP